MKKIIFLAVIAGVLGHAYKAMAQLPQAPLSIPSPNSASLGLYGEVPVGYFSGVPNISVPVYQLHENALDVPVSLNYHASGVRPDMHPGWVGLGWSLDAGGMVSRVVRDLPDDYSNPNYGQQIFGLYYNYNVLNVANWDQLPYMHQIADNTSMLNDTEPDEFVFSYPGGGGKFYLDETRHWKVKCDKPVKVTFNGQFVAVPFTAPTGTAMQQFGNTTSFSGFTITDEKGDQYVFGGNTNSIEYEMGIFSQNLDEWIAQTWYLTKIISADGYEVDLGYEKDDFIDQLYISMYIDRGTSTVNSGNIFNPQPSCSSNSWGNNEKVFINGKLISPSYLRSITSSTTRIIFDRSVSTELGYDQSAYDFQYSQWSQSHAQPFMPFLGDLETGYPACLSYLKWKRLDKISVEDADGNVRKSWSLAYNNSPTDRLMLTSVTEKGKDGGAKPPYQFYYDNSKPLPPYLAAKTDHWGFYNGTYADISNANTYFNTYYSNREPNAAYLLAGTLNKIIYPTGGVTDFTFEPNWYSKRLAFNRTDGLDATFNANTMAGGLRIQKISSYDPNSSDPPRTKEYFYVNGYTNATVPSSLPSSGILGGQIKYYFDDYRTTAFNDNGIVYSKSIFTSQSVLPASANSAGTHVGYSEVTEKLADGSYTRYFYTNFDNGHIDEPVPSLQTTRTPYEMATSLESERGLLLKTEVYNSNDVPVQRTETDYQALNKSAEFARALNVRYFNVCSNTAVSCDEGVAYRNYTYSYLPVSETITKYDVNGQHPIVTQRSMAYSNTYRQLSQETATDSKGQLTNTYYRYPYDVLAYTPSPSATSGETTAFMVQNNRVGQPVEVTRTKLIDGAEQVIDDKLTTYGVVSGLVKPAFTYKLNTTSPIAKTGFTSYAVTGYSAGEIVSRDTRLVPDMEYDAYDAKGNLQTFARNKGMKTTYLWDYGKNFPIAEVDNASAGQVAYTSFETSDLGGWTAGTGSSTLTANGNVTGQKSFSGTLSTTITVPGNYILTLWCPSGGTPTVNGQTGATIRTEGSSVLQQWKLTNPGTVTVQASNCDEVRLVPENARVNTYTYDPFGGMTTKNDWNGLSTFYEYDEFGRLHFVRDHDHNLIKKVNYGYRGAPGTTYYNAASSFPFIRKCSGVPGQAMYVVPAGKYSSVVSQDDANSLATREAVQYGQQWVQQNGSCDLSPLSIDYLKDGTVPFTVSFENLTTHIVYTFGFSAATNGTFVHLGDIPKGRYNVNFSTSSTSGHTFIIGGTGQNGTSTASFPNFSITIPYQGEIIINGNQ